MRNSEQGSLHVIVISVLAIALVGALGFIFWQNILQPKPSNVAMNNTTNSEEKTTPQTDKEVVPTDPNEGYVVLDDWGIRFKETNEKITWSKSSVNSYNKPSNDTYYFTTDKWTNLPTACNTEIPLIRMKEKSTVPTSPPVPLNKEKKIGNYYYYYVHPQSACGDDTLDDAEWMLQAETVMAFLETIEAKK